MAQPIRNILNNGQQSWDADVNDNFDQQWDIATPIPEHADFASLPAAAANENSIAMTVDDGAVYRSDGTIWIQVNQTTNQVDAGSAYGIPDISVVTSGSLAGLTTLTFAGIIPADSLFLGATAKVKVDLDVTWNLGDVVSAIRYASAKAVVKNTFSDISDHIAAASFRQVGAAEDIIVASTGVAWGAGEIEVTAHYIKIVPRPDFP